MRSSRLYKSPRRGASLRGLFVGLLSLSMPVKPLADVVTEDACRNRHEEIYEELHWLYTPSLLPDWVGQQIDCNRI